MLNKECESMSRDLCVPKCISSEFWRFHNAHYNLLPAALSASHSAEFLHITQARVQECVGFLSDALRAIARLIPERGEYVCAYAFSAGLSIVVNLCGAHFYRRSFARVLGSIQMWRRHGMPPVWSKNCTSMQMRPSHLPDLWAYYCIVSDIVAPGIGRIANEYVSVSWTELMLCTACNPTPEWGPRPTGIVLLHTAPAMSTGPRLTPLLFLLHIVYNFDTVLGKCNTLFMTL